ncbi:MAG: GNAT family N-acetyltransferase [Burkholderiales bacterium]
MLTGIMQWDEVYPSEECIKADIEAGHMYLLVCRGEAVSAVVINDEQDEEYKDGCWKYCEGNIAALHRLCVHPAHQRKGYGRETALFAERLMRRMGYTAVRLDAFSQNPSAQKLYEGLGYERAGEVTFRKGKFFLYEKLLRE